MRSLLPVLIIFLLTAIGSCKEPKEIKSFNRVIADTSTDKNFDLALEDFTKKLQLPSIRNGADSFEYRFWLCGEEPDLMNLIRIKFENSSWVITETLIWSHIPKYQFSRNDTVNHLQETIVDSTKSRPITASININKFIDSLQYFNLEQSPSNIEINNSYTAHMDGWSHSIELADKYEHRLIVYPCPVSITGWQNFHQSMKKLFSFLRRNLPIEFGPC